MIVIVGHDYIYPRHSSMAPMVYLSLVGVMLAKELVGTDIGLTLNFCDRLDCNIADHMMTRLLIMSTL